jgi:hypothetical protein
MKKSNFLGVEIVTPDRLLSENLACLSCFRPHFGVGASRFTFISLSGEFKKTAKSASKRRLFRDDTTSEQF